MDPWSYWVITHLYTQTAGLALLTHGTFPAGTTEHVGTHFALALELLKWKRYTSLTLCWETASPGFTHRAALLHYSRAGGHILIHMNKNKMVVGFKSKRNRFMLIRVWSNKPSGTFENRISLPRWDPKMKTCCFVFFHILSLISYHPAHLRVDILIMHRWELLMFAGSYHISYVQIQLKKWQQTDLEEKQNRGVDAVEPERTLFSVWREQRMRTEWEMSGRAGWDRKGEKANH